MEDGRRVRSRDQFFKCFPCGSVASDPATYNDKREEGHTGLITTINNSYERADTRNDT